MVKSNKNVIVSAVLAIALCFCMLVGTTFAYFTANSKVNIAITSGKINVTATTGNFQMYSMETIDATTFEGNMVERTDGTFIGGGTATLDGAELVLDKIMPGDKVTFDITVANQGNVKALYRYGYYVEAAEGGDLTAAQNFYRKLKFGLGEINTAKYLAYKTAWAETLDINVLNVSVELPASATNTTGEELSGKIVFIVEAVQANVLVSSDEEFTLATSEALIDAIGTAEEGETISIATGSFSLSNTTEIANGVTIGGTSKEETTLNIEKLPVTNDNVTFKDMTIKGDAPAGNAGSLDISGDSATLENVKFIGSGFNGDTKAISVGSATGAVFKDCHISNAFRGIIFWDNIGGENIIENCIIEKVIYTFNINAATVKPGTTILVKNSTLNGWTSYAAIDKATFIGCNLGMSYDYAYMVAYTDTDMTDCIFNDGYQFAAGATGKTFTFTNCKLGDGTKITAENFAEKLGDVDDALKGCTVIVDGVTVSWN